MLLMERAWENKQKMFPQTSALQFLDSGMDILELSALTLPIQDTDPEIKKRAG